jgi:hypothetical protein
VKPSQWRRRFLGKINYFNIRLPIKSYFKYFLKAILLLQVHKLARNQREQVIKQVSVSRDYNISHSEREKKGCPTIKRKPSVEGQISDISCARFIVAPRPSLLSFFCLAQLSRKHTHLKSLRVPFVARSD